MLSKDDVKMLRGWDRVASEFRHRYLSYGGDGFQFKDLAFREVYGELISETIQLLPANPNILKTDLWNEGVEDGRNLAAFAKTAKDDGRLMCIDVSSYVCESAKKSGDSSYSIIHATLLASPFRPKFDFIIDASTVDHMPERLRQIWISAEASMLKEKGFLLISFDCRLNLFDELYHRMFTRKMYPEWTLVPSRVRAQLESLGLRIVREHAIFVAGFFWGTHRPLFPFSRLLKRRGVLQFVKRMELSGHSRWLSFVAPQYVLVATKVSK